MSTLPGSIISPSAITEFLVAYTPVPTTVIFLSPPMTTLSSQVTSSSMMARSMVQALPISDSCMMMLSRTVVPRPMVTPGNSTLFSTSPSTLQPSPMMEFFTRAPSPM